MLLSRSRHRHPGGIVTDASMSKPALKRCTVCRQPVARKKLVLAADGRPVHRACHSPAARPSARPAAPSSGLIRAPKDISRAELLRRIEALRKRDAKKKPTVAKKATVAKKPSVGQKPQAAKVSRGAKVPSAGRPAASASSHRGKGAVIPPQPYYGVEMKFINGRWVQMHPDSE